MFIGQYTSKLTENNRLAIPKRFREELGEVMIVARWYENCLVLVSSANWRTFLKRLVGDTGIITLPVRDIDRFIFGSAFEVDLDRQGRFVLPEILKTFAKINSEVSFVGLGDRIEIWSLESWRELEEKVEEKASFAIEKVAKEKKI